MEVSSEIKALYNGDSIHKELIIEFPEIGLHLGNDEVWEETFNLKEALLDNDFEFVGCIASSMSVTVSGVTKDIKGKKISVSIRAQGTEPIALFHGIVDSVMRQTNRSYKQITAYDQLYEKGKVDVSAWYKHLSFPISLRDIRDSLFGYLGIMQEEIALPNDDVMISKQYDPQSLKAIAVIKAICQINGAFGIINRKDKFEYRILPDMRPKSDVPYPSLYLFPGESLYPGANITARTLAQDNNIEFFSYYKKVDYEEYLVKPVDRLTIRQGESEAGVSFGEGSNNYIIQGNMFTYGLSDSELLTIAEKIYQNVKGITYCPYTSDNNGLPYVECGIDAVSYYVMTEHTNTRSIETYDRLNFYVMSRELNGIQALRDNYSAEGEEYQTEFITDLQTQIDVIKQDVKKEVEKTIKEYDFSSEFGKYTYSSSQIDQKLAEMGEGIKIVSVAALPDVPDHNTVYLIQGEVTVN